MITRPASLLGLLLLLLGLTLVACPTGDDDDDDDAAGDDDDAAGDDDDGTGDDDDDATGDDDDDDDSTTPPDDDDDSGGNNDPPFTPVDCTANGQEDCDAPGACDDFEYGCMCVESPFGNFCTPCCVTGDDCPVGPSGDPLICNTDLPSLTCPSSAAVGACTI